MPYASTKIHENQSEQYCVSILLFQRTELSWTMKEHFVKCLFYKLYNISISLIILWLQQVKRSRSAVGVKTSGENNDDQPWFLTSYSLWFHQSHSHGVCTVSGLNHEGQINQKPVDCWYSMQTTLTGVTVTHFCDNNVTLESQSSHYSRGHRRSLGEKNVNPLF